jgi:hypothetical protein
MNRITKIAAAAAFGGSAIVALSACSAAVEATPTAPQPTATATAAVPEPTTSASTSTAGASTGRVTEPKREATTKGTKTTAGNGWAAVSWKTVTFDALNCPHLNGYTTADVSSVQYSDLTGDGRKEAVVAASCRTTTAQNPISVFVYDGANTKQPLKRLLSIGVHSYLVTAKVTIDGKTVTVNSKALSDKAPRCCPDLRIIQSSTWRNGSFSPISYAETAL